MNEWKAKWNQFAAQHPAASKWVREGGLFVLVCNLVTVLKYFILPYTRASFLRPWRNRNTPFCTARPRNGSVICFPGKKRIKTLTASKGPAQCGLGEVPM